MDVGKQGAAHRRVMPDDLAVLTDDELEELARWVEMLMRQRDRLNGGSRDGCIGR